MTSSLTRIINSAEAVHCSAQSESSSAHHHRSAPPPPRHHHHHHLILLMTTDHHHHLLIIIILHLIRSRGAAPRVAPRWRLRRIEGHIHVKKSAFHFISSAEIRPISEQLNSESISR